MECGRVDPMAAHPGAPRGANPRRSRAGFSHLGPQRRIGATIPNFSQVPALLARSDLLATMTPLVMDGTMDALGLVAL